MNLKAQLEFYLKLRGMTAAQLARKSGVSKQVLSLWLGNASPRNIEQVKKVAEALGVSIDHLCFGRGEAQPDLMSEGSNSSRDDWISGFFEVRLRRLKEPPSSKQTTK